MVCYKLSWSKIADLLLKCLPIMVKKFTYQEKINILSFFIGDLLLFEMDKNKGNSWPIWGKNSIHKSKYNIKSNKFTGKIFKSIKLLLKDFLKEHINEKDNDYNSLYESKAKVTYT